MSGSDANHTPGPLEPPSFGGYLRHLRTTDAAGFPAGAPARPRPRMSRDDLAAAAGVSTGYVIKLEQRLGNPSADIVDRLADALHCSPVERQHLHDLATAQLPGAATARAGYRPPEITDVMKQMVDNLVPQLAGYVDDAWNVLYANSEYARIFRGITRVGNVLAWFFGVPESRAIMVEWETEARLTVAWLRGLMARRPAEPMFEQVLEALAGYPDFRAMWERQELLMGRHTQHMRVRDLDRGTEFVLLAQVHKAPDPTVPVQMYLGTRSPDPGAADASGAERSRP
ncbi:transcriptional regulator (plasmid) [Amycolatopsis sp. AA4]|nr:transcriptional regulator [Amycolatopsis sp. AA4]